ncbi:hypothetical protein EBT31_06045 [bacterium]|nr:hypothetical protein [bacterium]
MDRKTHGAIRVHGLQTLGELTAAISKVATTLREAAATPTSYWFTPLKSELVVAYEGRDRDGGPYMLVRELVEFQVVRVPALSPLAPSVCFHVLGMLQAQSPGSHPSFICYRGMPPCVNLGGTQRPIHELLGIDAIEDGDMPDGTFMVASTGTANAIADTTAAVIIQVEDAN